jgi:hypothetical protein
MLKLCDELIKGLAQDVFTTQTKITSDFYFIKAANGTGKTIKKIHPAKCLFIHKASASSLSLQPLQFEKKNISNNGCSNGDIQGDFEICADILTSARTPQ